MNLNSNRKFKASLYITLATYLKVNRKANKKSTASLKVLSANLNTKRKLEDISKMISAMNITKMK